MPNFKVPNSDIRSTAFRVVLRATFAFTTLALATLLSTSPASAANSSGARAFIERSWPSSYEAVENLFDEHYSKTADIVVLRTRAGQPVSALALKARDTGDYLLTLSVPSDDAESGWLRIDTEFDGAVGRQVARAIELKVHHQVIISAGPRSVSKTESDIWIFQRGQTGRIAAAVITADAAYDNPSADLFIDELLGGLQQSIGADGAARDELLQKIDRIATRIILSDPDA